MDIPNWSFTCELDEDNSKTVREWINEWREAIQKGVRIDRIDNLTKEYIIDYWVYDPPLILQFCVDEETGELVFTKEKEQDAY